MIRVCYRDKQSIGTQDRTNQPIKQTEQQQAHTHYQTNCLLLPLFFKTNTFRRFPSNAYYDLLIELLALARSSVICITSFSFLLMNSLSDRMVQLRELRSNPSIRWQSERVFLSSLASGSWAIMWVVALSILTSLLNFWPRARHCGNSCCSFSFWIIVDMSEQLFQGCVFWLSSFDEFDSLHWESYQLNYYTLWLSFYKAPYSSLAAI